MHQAPGANWKQEIITRPIERKTAHVELACKERHKNLLLVRIREQSENISVSGWHKYLCRMCAVMPIDLPCVQVRRQEVSYIIRYLNVTVASKHFLSSLSLMVCDDV